MIIFDWRLLYHQLVIARRTPLDKAIPFKQRFDKFIDHEIASLGARNNGGCHSSESWNPR